MVETAGQTFQIVPLFSGCDIAAQGGKDFRELGPADWTDFGNLGSGEIAEGDVRQAAFFGKEAETQAPLAVQSDAGFCMA